MAPSSGPLDHLVRPGSLAALAHAEPGETRSRARRNGATWNPFAFYAPASSAVGLFR
jgi:hypothetical protein